MVKFHLPLFLSASTIQANQAIRVDVLCETEEGVEECSRIFLDSESRFSNCFEAVDPRPYFWHCVTSFNRPKFDLANANAVCNVASAYKTQCLNQKIRLPNLMECAEGKWLLRFICCKYYY